MSRMLYNVDFPCFLIISLHPGNVFLMWFLTLGNNCFSGKSDVCAMSYDVSGNGFDISASIVFDISWSFVSIFLNCCNCFMYFMIDNLVFSFGV